MRPKASLASRFPAVNPRAPDAPDATARANESARHAPWPCQAHWQATQCFWRIGATSRTKLDRGSRQGRRSTRSKAGRGGIRRRRRWHPGRREKSGPDRGTVNSTTGSWELPPSSAVAIGAKSASWRVSSASSTEPEALESTAIRRRCPAWPRLSRRRHPVAARWPRGSTAPRPPEDDALGRAKTVIRLGFEKPRSDAKQREPERRLSVRSHEDDRRVRRGRRGEISGDRTSNSTCVSPAFARERHWEHPPSPGREARRRLQPSSRGPPSPPRAGARGP